MQKLLLSFLLTLLLTSAATAQTDSSRQLFEQAAEEYQIGHVEQARQLLTQHLSRLNGSLREGAYRLLALCALADDDDASAERYVRLLLQANPYYSPSIDDPQPLSDIVAAVKTSQTATITTASQQAETLEEAPVPVTLITEEMIRLSTARNLRELLVDYVPGMAAQEGEEVNLSVRGVMSNYPETILFLRNGVRMNSHWSTAIAPDFRISLANIRQIEVLRGPASSLYGNAALTSVVNIITKDGSDIDGLQVTGGGGNGHTVKGDLLIGKRFLESSLLMWGSLYSSRGTLWNVSADSPLDNYDYVPKDGSLYVGGYNHPPAYDLGLNYTWRGLSLYLTHQHGKLVMPYSPGGRLYDYDSVIDYPEGKSGISSIATTANLRYVHEWRRWTVEANATGMFETINNDVSYVADKKDFNSYDLRSFSGDVKCLYNYPQTSIGQGNILVGLQVENDGLRSSEHEANIAEEGAIFSNMIYYYILTNLTERTYSPFLQLKHSFSPRLILNAGLRYDFRDREIGANVSQLSPRVALIWSPLLKHPSSDVNFKLAYGHSFVDLSLYNRFFYYDMDGELWMEPNNLDNIQLSATLTHRPSSNTTLQIETNLFYTYASKFLFVRFVQAKYSVYGWENTFSYKRPSFSARLTTYLQRVSEHEWKTVTSSAANGRLPIPPLNGSPSFLSHLQLSQRLCSGLWLTANTSFASRNTFSANGVIFYNLNDPQWPKDNPEQVYSLTLPAYFLFDLGANYSWRNVELKLTCKNLTNLRYRLTGEESVVPQQGRTILATATFTLGR